MIVMIATQNQKLVRKYLPRVKFTPMTENTCTFEIRGAKFSELIGKVVADGYNQYNLFTW